jgi:hypothetical protein
MIITDLDRPLTAEEARKIAMNNREDSADRCLFREIMQAIREVSSWGSTRYVMLPAVKERMPTDHVCRILLSMGYKVSVKRSYKWDSEGKEYTDKPDIDSSGREQFYAEITWG